MKNAEYMHVISCLLCQTSRRQLADIVCAGLCWQSSLPLRQVTFNILTVLLIFRCSHMQNMLRTPNLTAPAGSEATIRASVSRFQMDWILRQADEVLYFEFPARMYTQ